MKKMKARIFLGVLVIVGVVALIVGYQLYEKVKQENAILQELGDVFSDYSYVTDYEIDGKNDVGNIPSVVVHVSEDFNELRYAEMEDFIHRVESGFFTAYLDVMIKSMTQDQLDNYQVLAKVVCGNTVYTYQVGDAILKDGIPFDSETFYRAAFMERYELNDADLGKLSEISDDILDEILTMKDTDECKKEINYQYGLAVFKNADFSSAKDAFSDLANENYKDADKLFQESEIMEAVQGTWETADTSEYQRVIFDGWKMCIVYKPIILLGVSNNYQYVANTGLASIDDSNFIIFTDDREFGTEIKFLQNTFYLEENKLYQVLDSSLQRESIKVSEDTTFPDIVELEEPYIGMTAEEVRTKSTWGNPEDINTTVTTGITYEQWCYPGFKYIYLENGIVTAIQK